MVGTPREKAMSMMAPCSNEAEAFWRAANVNEAMGRAEVGSGMRVTVRNRGARAVAQSGIDIGCKCVVGRGLGLVWDGMGGTDSRFRFRFIQ